ncbi:MAG: glycosyltransferase [Clostridia bacterium]|nr:glycosyltransferase [Clostridia bacterium]
MKKVLYVATVFSHVCQFHLPYLKEFKEKGYEVWVAGRNNLAEKNGLKLSYADNAVEIPFRRSPFSLKNFKALKKLKKLINAEGFDLIICNTPVGALITRLAGKKARKKGTKIVYIAHGFHFYKGAPKKNWLMYYPIEKLMAKRTDVLMTITKEDYALATQKFKTTVKHIHGMGVNDKRHYPVSEDEKLKLRKELNVNEGDFICLCTGELNANKNQKYLIGLVPKLKEQIPNFRLWLAGNGPNKSELENEIKSLNVENCVTLLGYQPAIEYYVRACDVVLSASKREGLPFNVVEAMLTKKPVVVSVNRGHRELVPNSEIGFMTNDEAEFTKAIVDLYNDKELYDNVANSAYDYAKSYALSSTEREFFDNLSL